MLSVWIYTLLLPPALSLARDDFRTRSVAVAWLGILTAASLAVGMTTAGLRSMLLHTALNTCVVFLLTGAMMLCEVLRHRPLREFFARSFGVGDTATMLAATPLFDTEAYVRFLLASGIAALGWWTVKRPATIPLAGFMALALAGYALFKITGLWS